MAGLDSFTTSRISVKSDHPSPSIELFVRTKGDGRPLLLLHGYPQTGRMWHKIAGELAEQYTVIVPDLRGYGRSDKPAGSSSHIEYSKRTMARDMVQLMSALGFSSFAVAGHDRGGRVAHRMALDYPEKVERLMVLDIAPTLFAFENMTHKSASDKWHWLLLSQETPHVEKFILAQPEIWWDMYHDRSTFSHVNWFEEDVVEYRGGLETKEGVHATVEDYRAAATIDLEHDRQSREEGRRITLPKVYVVYGNLGHVADATQSWKGFVGDSTELIGKGLESGHYVAEERPDEVLAAILEMMRD